METKTRKRPYPYYSKNRAYCKRMRCLTDETASRSKICNSFQVLRFVKRKSAQAYGIKLNEVIDHRTIMLNQYKVSTRNTVETFEKRKLTVGPLYGS